MAVNFLTLNYKYDQKQTNNNIADNQKMTPAVIEKETCMATIAFIGLGQMGSPMASNLIKKGHSLRVFDLNPQADASAG